jgi:hypothetical protein
MDMSDIETANEKILESGKKVSSALVKVFHARRDGIPLNLWEVEGLLHDAINDQALALHAIRRIRRNEPRQ